MFRDYNRYKVLKVFLDSPTESFGLREISRIAGVAPPSVINYLKEFEEEELISRIVKKINPEYTAKRENEKFKLYKKISIIYELHESGLISFLWNKISPEVIILYGSYAKGESIGESDIDIFIIGKKKDLDLKSFEKKLGKEIHLMFDDKVKNIPNELKNNLINGIVLEGYFKAF